MLHYDFNCGKLFYTKQYNIVQQPIFIERAFTFSGTKQLVLDIEYSDVQSVMIRQALSHM